MSNEEEQKQNAVIGLVSELDNMRACHLEWLARVAKHTRDPEAVHSFLATFDALYARMVELYGEEPVTLLVCETCGSPDVEAACWYAVNTGELGDGIDGHGFFCPCCNSDCAVEEVTVPVREGAAKLRELRSASEARGCAEDDDTCGEPLDYDPRKP